MSQLTCKYNGLFELHEVLGLFLARSPFPFALLRPQARSLEIGVKFRLIISVPKKEPEFFNARCGRIDICLLQGGQRNGFEKCYNINWPLL